MLDGMYKQKMRSISANLNTAQMNKFNKLNGFSSYSPTTPGPAIGRFGWRNKSGTGGQKNKTNCCQ
jgi:hypothetical protein